MNLKKIMAPDQMVELVVREGVYEGRYRSRIDEVGEKVLSVGAPFVERQIIPLREKTELEVFFYDELSAYSFMAVIMQRIAIPVPIFVLEVKGNIRKVQRRNYVRVPAFYPIEFRTVARDGLSDLKKGYMMDLSGGGTCFHTTEKIENKSLLFTHLKLPTGEIQTPGRVCRVVWDDENKRNIVSVEFYDIVEKERDKIIRCVFDIQRSLIKKGLN